MKSKKEISTDKRAPNRPLKFKEASALVCVRVHDSHRLLYKAAIKQLVKALYGQNFTIDNQLVIKLVKKLTK